MCKKLTYLASFIVLLGLASTNYGVVIGDFEEGSMDNWGATWEGSPVFANSTTGATLGSESLSVLFTGYWGIQWNAPSVPESLAGTKLTFDLTMIASEWPIGHWTKVADKIALNSNSATGWQEYTTATAIDKVTGESTSTDWGRWTDTAPDVVKTYSVDISDYDLTGATWFQINISIQGGDGMGYYYFDNIQLITEDAQPPADTTKTTDIIIGNWEQDMDGWVVGGGADVIFNDHNGVTLGDYSLDIYLPNGDWNQDVLTLDVIGNGLLDLYRINQKVSVDVTRLVADWPTDQIPGWNGVHMVVNAGGNGWSIWENMGYQAGWRQTNGDQTLTATWDYSQYFPNMDFDNITWLELKVVSNANDPAYTGWVWFYLDNMKLFGGGAALEPQPAKGATDVPIDSTLTWIVGAFAASHRVYFGKDAARVNNADMDSDPEVMFVELDEATFDPNIMEYKTQYYWRVDEVNEANPDSPWKGLLWNFTTGNFNVVDDFEDYDAVENRIWYAWHDGLGYGTPDTEPYFAGNGTGSAVGDDTTPSFCEETIVHYGGKSMPISFNNTGNATISEVERTWDEPQDWTVNNFNALKLYIQGASFSTAAELYLLIEDNAGNSYRATNTDTTILTTDQWKEWVIPHSEISTAGVNMTAIIKLVIGVADLAGQAGANGKFYVDDIRNGFEPVGLVAHYAFENNVEDSSGNGHHGTLAGDPNFPVAYVNGPDGLGQAMLLDGTDNHQHVYLGNFNPSAATDKLTIALWAKWDGPSNSWQAFMGKRNSGDWDRDIMMWYFELERDAWDIRFAREGSSINTGQTLEVGVWTHLAVTFDGTTAKVYVNGVVIDEGDFSFGNDTEAPMQIGAATGGGGNPFNGTLDEVRIYDIALSEAEILELAGQ